MSAKSIMARPRLQISEFFSAFPSVPLVTATACFYEASPRVQVEPSSRCDRLGFASVGTFAAKGERSWLEKQLPNQAIDGGQ